MFVSKAGAYLARAPLSIIGPFLIYEEIQQYKTGPRMRER
jgi:hypothetical protein